MINLYLICNIDVYEQNGINLICKKEIVRMDVNQQQYDLILYENVFLK